MEPGSSHGRLVKEQGEQAQATAEGRAVRGHAGCCPHEGGQPWSGSAFPEAVRAWLALSWAGVRAETSGSLPASVIWSFGHLTDICSQAQVCPSPFGLKSLAHLHSKCRPNTRCVPTDQDSDSDSDLSLDEERSLSIPSSESEENVRLRGRFQRQFKRAAHSERLLTNPTNTTPKGKSQGLWQGKG